MNTILNSQEKKMEGGVSISLLMLSRIEVYIEELEVNGLF
jgi:hypothetical protein